MEDVSNVRLTPISSSKYVKPTKVSFKQNGIETVHNLLQVHDSVIIIIYNTTREKLIFVKQFRPAVYIGSLPSDATTESIDCKKYPAGIGCTLELCAGIVDKNKSLVEIAKEEVLEECGYDVPLSKLELVCTNRVDPRSMGAKQTMFYCEVTDDMKVSEGGGIHDELIEVVEFSKESIKEYVSQRNINSPQGFIYGLYWFFLNKDHKNIQ